MGIIRGESQIDVGSGDYSFYLDAQVTESSHEISICVLVFKHCTPVHLGGPMMTLRGHS